MKNIKIILIFITSIIILQISCSYSNRQILTKNHFIKREDPLLDSKMIIGIQCRSANSTLCDKIIRTINDVGKAVSSVILFNQPILVNVIVANNCVVGESGCIREDPDFIGSAEPGSRVLLADDSGVDRYYPQPLAKQFFTEHPRYNDIDILARFALRENYWFPGDPLPVNSTQILDFSYVVLHEIIHSLGFESTWDTWFRQDVIAPSIVPEPHCKFRDSDGDCDIRKSRASKNRIWTNFKENIFDKYLMNLHTGEMLTNKTANLNKLFDSGTVSGRINKLDRKLRDSPQFDIAKEMYGLATTGGNIGFLSWNDSDFSNCLVLETKLVPFDEETSIRHADNELYNNTSDFLMRYPVSLGKTLQGEIIAGGGYEGGTLPGSIGPKLRRVLETLGYATVDRPYTSNKPSLPTPDSEYHNSSGRSLSTTLYQTCLLLIIVTCFMVFTL